MSDRDPQIMQTQFDITVRDVTYTFRIPGIQYDMQVGARAAAIRRLADPEGMGALVDGASAQFSRCCAILELYLEAATDAWPFGGLTAMPAARPRVDHQRFPRNKITTVYLVGAAFETEFARFRDDRPVDGDTAGGETVAGVENSGT